MPESFHLESLRSQKPPTAHIKLNSLGHRWHRRLPHGGTFDDENETIRLTEEFDDENETEDRETDYVNMLLQLDNTIPTLHNILAASFTWLLLAGYLVLPATFAHQTSKAGKLVLRAYQYLPLLWIAAVLCAIGAIGMGWLWWTWNLNYIWLRDRIIFPGLMHSATGLATTILNIYTAKNGLWSVTAIVTTVVTGVCTMFMLAMYILYDSILLARVKKDHESEVQRRKLLAKLKKGDKSKVQRLYS